MTMFKYIGWPCYLLSLPSFPEKFSLINLVACVLSYIQYSLLFVCCAVTMDISCSAG